MKTYLIKVRFTLSGLTVYKVETKDIYHWVGKFYLSSIEKIEDIRYSNWTQESENYWVEQGYTVINNREL